MPEGDTIHHAARRIGTVLEGRVPDEIRCPQRRHARDRWAERLAGRRVCAVDAHGKHLFLRFADGLTLHSHLRMTGLWGVYEQGRRWSRSPRRAWLIVRAAGHEVVQFDGPVLELVTDSRTRSDQRLAGLGPDILGDEFDERRFLTRLREDDPGRPIADAVIDQRTVAGIGNVWKAEACFAVGLDPWRPAGRVSTEEALGLVRAARAGMQVAVAEGPLSRPRAVYGRGGLPCTRCGARIRRRGQGDDNRLTYWCPVCQA